MNKEHFEKAYKKALGGGTSGSLAMITQVTTLMWLRTTINYQYVNGTDFRTSMKTLYNNGGFIRFYRGYPLALSMAPLSRFGDTATNLGILELTKDSNLPLSIRTGISSLCAGGWRVVLMPLDTIKTNYQVNGEVKTLFKNVKSNGVKPLYNGSAAAFTTCVSGHFPWFFTYNFVSEILPEKEDDTLLQTLGKRATTGLGASLVSDTCSNSIKVLKTIKQTQNQEYSKIIKELIKKDGYKWIFRGLKTRYLVNGMNSILFSITWKYYQSTLFNL